MLGQRIAMLRKQNGYSQAELAGRLQISSGSVGMYEQGRREPSADLLVAIAREFHVSIDYLLTGQPGKNTDFLLNELLDAAQERLHRRADPLSRQELAVLLAAILTNQP